MANADKNTETNKAAMLLWKLNVNYSEYGIKTKLRLLQIIIIIIIIIIITMCYVEAKHSSSDPVSNIIYCSNPKVTTVKSKKT